MTIQRGHTTNARFRVRATSHTATGTDVWNQCERPAPLFSQPFPGKSEHRNGIHGNRSSARLQRSRRVLLGANIPVARERHVRRCHPLHHGRDATHGDERTLFDTAQYFRDHRATGARVSE